MDTTMENNPDLESYITGLVESVYGDDLSEAEMAEAVTDLTQAFYKLFNARLMERFSDDQLDQVERLVNDNQLDKISEFAYNSGINVTSLLVEVMSEFQQLYAPGAE